ncbi:hypothetical protein Lsed01_00858 [Demequina sediminis]|uniref:Prepilin-type N-terminal cleavage/methylation domain-containing protein n=1 Tax=Demequina sediminis TaxID=1930058 RepID=A0ABP9WIH2_9MICO|nr:prepilin-type N-terminal cleavage/methylation domain-containing protein [Demequina sediminis]BDZ62488.1 hypothetical protein GCM10025873_22790 [Demequina sediminis]
MLTPTHTPRTRSESGFTMMEVLTAILIVGLLASIAIPTYLSQKEVVASQRLQTVMTSVSIAVERDGKLNTGIYPSALPSDVPIPTSIQVQYVTTGSEWCAEAFDIDTKDKDIFHISGDGADVSDLTEGGCPEANLPLDSPVLEADLNEMNAALLRWSAVEGADYYEVLNVTTGMVTTTESNVTAWTSEVLDDHPTQFRVTAVAQGRPAGVSNVIEVRPVPPQVVAPEITVTSSAGFIGASTVDFTWTPVQNAEVVRYEVQNSQGGMVYRTYAPHEEFSFGAWFERDTYLVVVAYDVAGEEVARSTALYVHVNEG